jgi:hypothetical protein
MHDNIAVRHLAGEVPFAANVHARVFADVPNAPARRHKGSAIGAIVNDDQLLVVVILRQEHLDGRETKHRRSVVGMMHVTILGCSSYLLSVVGLFNPGTKTSSPGVCNKVVWVAMPFLPRTP